MNTIVVNRAALLPFKVCLAAQRLSFLSSPWKFVIAIDKLFMHTEQNYGTHRWVTQPEMSVAIQPTAQSPT